MFENTAITTVSASTDLARLMHLTFLSSTILLQTILNYQIATQTSFTAKFELVWLAVCLIMPYLDLHFLADYSEQSFVLVNGNWWILWLAGAVQFYFSYVNYDMVFGSFMEYFGLETSTNTKLVAKTYWWSSVSAMASLFFYSYQMKGDFTLYYNSIEQMPTSLPQL